MPHLTYDEARRMADNDIREFVARNLDQGKARYTRSRKDQLRFLWFLLRCMWVVFRENWLTWPRRAGTLVLDMDKLDVRIEPEK